jgi:heme oxygenase
MIHSNGGTMQRLRDATRDEHERAEHHAFQQAMFKGELSRSGYTAWLGQMYLVHDALETALRRSAAEHEPIRRVVRDYQYQVPYLREDLEFFGIDSEQIEPTPATERFISLIEKNQSDPVLLLGMHYVLEGSNNGSRFVARQVAKAYDLAPGAGLRYLVPYGDKQREYWMTFKNDMSQVNFTEEEASRLVEAAKAMYQTVAELSDDLSAVSE